MRAYSSVSFVSCLLITTRTFSGVQAQNASYPTESKNDGFNSTESHLDLGITPLIPVGDIKENDLWATPLTKGCPKLCSIVGSDPANWTNIHDQEDLRNCKEPLLFDLNVQNEPDRYATIRTCAVTAPKVETKRAILSSVSFLSTRQNEKVDVLNLEAVERFMAASDSCGAQKSTAKATFSAGPSVLKQGNDASSAVDLLASYLADSASCGSTILFAKSGTAIVGLYADADLQQDSAGRLIRELRLSRVVPYFLMLFTTRVSYPESSLYMVFRTSTFLADGDVSLETHFQRGSQAVQSCNAATRSAQTLGLFAIDSVDDLSKAQEAVKTWGSGKCIDISGAETLGEAMELGILGDNLNSTSNSSFNSTSVSVRSVKEKVQISSDADAEVDAAVALMPRADCRAIQAISGDGCGSLAGRCGISGADFTKFNTKTNLCSTLMPKQWVCCSAGTLPDMRPKPQADGTCAIHTIAPNDGCWAIADTYGITQTDIDTYNKKTWGWAGCTRLQPGQILCLSTGNTPMPASVEGVVCGPQKPGTSKPSGNFDGFALAKLNQCPLKACCSGWGFCGTTTEFCVESPADTGAPGAFKAGSNGCISNCGTDIVGNSERPGGFARVGYFQGYNPSRDCLTMDASEIMNGVKGLTHVHFAFAGLTADFNVQIADNVRDQFDKFNAMAAPFKKIISFGGWAESTEPGTFQRYRDAVAPANRNKFAANVLAFLDKHKLDGVDFDWEYPGAADIPGVPPGDVVEGQNYLRFLTVMRGLLGTGKRSLSIALPSSFWYLKPFPVDKMAEVLDYFVYMTYDIHGQWDYGNKFANPGCPNGNCLRSHINITETHNALSMITKAGVPARKIFVGISSYGRSFRMTDPKCTGPQCTFSGSFTVSDAEAGQCTGTGGYISNAELNEIYDYAQAGVSGFQAKKWYDKATDSDIMTWFVFVLRVDDGTRGNGMTDWVAYMDGTTKANRIEWIRNLNFGGVSDWAVDLSGWFEGVSDNDGGGWDVEADNLECDSTSWPTTLESLESGIASVPTQCRGMALVKILYGQLESAISEYRTVSKDYNDKFGWYADWVKDAIDERLDEFLAIKRGEGLKYMDCKWETRKNKGSGPCTEATLQYDLGLNPGPRIVEFTMRDEKGFYEALLQYTGIQKGWIRWTDHAISDPCSACGPKPPPCPEQAMCLQNYYMRKNFPRRIKDTGDIDVPNPKKIVDDAIPNLDELASIAFGTYTEMRLGILDADDVDISTSLSMPIFMLQDASAAIKEVKEIGEEQKETKTRNLILNILTIIFAVIPFAGQATQLLGGAAKIATAALIIGEAGNAAITIAEIVKDPTSAPFAILGMLLGAGGIRAKGPRSAFKDAADARRALTSKDLALFSKEFVRKDGLVQNIAKACMR